MKIAVFVLIASCVSINAQFSKNLDSLNVDMILKNDRILTNYLKCLLDKGKEVQVEEKSLICKFSILKGRALTKAEN